MNFFFFVISSLNFFHSISLILVHMNWIVLCSNTFTNLYIMILNGFCNLSLEAYTYIHSFLFDVSLQSILLFHLTIPLMKHFFL